MARDTRSIWAKRVERWRDSGLTANEFAAELGINARTLSYWKYRLKKEDRVEAAAPAFVEAAVMPAQPASRCGQPVEVFIGDVRLQVPLDFDADQLTRLIAVVRDAC